MGKQQYDWENKRAETCIETKTIYRQQKRRYRKQKEQKIRRNGGVGAWRRIKRYYDNDVCDEATEEDEDQK